MSRAWTYALDSEICNGDVLIRTAKGRLVAIVYSTGDEAKTLERARMFCSAASPGQWCSTCGKNTLVGSTCPGCEAFWAAAHD